MPHFIKLMKRRISLLGSDIFLNAWNDCNLFYTTTGIKTCVKNFEFIESDAWFDMDWFDEIIASYKNESPETFYVFTQRGYQAGDAVIQYCSRFSKISTKENDPVNHFFSSTDLLKQLSEFIPVTHPLVMIIERKVASILRKKGVVENKISEALLEVSVPVKNNGPEEELLELKKIKKRMHDPDFDLENALQRHYQKYSYLGYRDVFSSGYTLDFFRQSLLERDIAEQGLDHSQKQPFRFTPEEQGWVDLLKEFVYFRNYRTEKFFQALFLLEPLWKTLAVKHGLDEKDLFFYLFDEARTLLATGKTIDAAILTQRKNGFAFLLHEGQIKLITGEDLKNKEQALKAAEHPSDGKIRGMVVCKGNVIGIVRIIHDDSELGKISEGEILVAGMTTPDYIPAMRKAAAFVTDEGGITCHAAIVAREMKKPCIVGTKTATQLLKDGDTVEVDAMKGMVNILG